MHNEQFLSLTVSDKLWHVASNPNAASFAYERLAVCRRAARTQMRRIWEAAESAKAEALEPSPNPAVSEMRAIVNSARTRFTPLLYEAHFYFVAWANCGNMLRVLTGQRVFLEAKKTFDTHRWKFEHYTAARNSFEHYHDRLPGNTEERRVREVVQVVGASPSRIYFGFEGGNYKHSDMTWDITPASLSMLDAAIDETLAVLHQQIEALFLTKFLSS